MNMNVELLRRIQAHITEEPRRFFMEWYVAKTEVKDGIPQWADDAFGDLSETPPPCGTAACIAGWACILSGRGTDLVGIAARARDELGLSYHLSQTVFSVIDWPTQFRNRYYAAKSPEQRADVACDRIDYLIEEGE